MHNADRLSSKAEGTTLYFEAWANLVAMDIELEKTEIQRVK